MTPTPWIRPGQGVQSVRLHWGLPDAAVAWVVGVIVAVVAGSIAISVGHYESTHLDDHLPVFAATVIGQYGGTLLYMLWVSRRKGRGSLRADFGLALRPTDWRWIPIGVSLQIAVLIGLAPIAHLATRHQSVVEDIDKAGGVKLVVLALTALVVAPVVEELLFRGLLLRALARRMRPEAAVTVSAVTFAAVHLVDPGAIGVLPGLVVLGMISGVVALRGGDLSRSILLHMGFNTVAVLAALLS